MANLFAIGKKQTEHGMEQVSPSQFPYQRKDGRDSSDFTNQRYLEYLTRADIQELFVAGYKETKGNRELSVSIDRCSMDFLIQWFPEQCARYQPVSGVRGGVGVHAAHNV
jgi:hypothetical protein